MNLPSWLFRSFGICALALCLGACAGQQRYSPFEAPSEQGSLLVYLNNQGFNEVRVYAITGGGSEPMGIVSGNSQRRASLQWRQLSQIVFRIEVLAGRTYTTHSLPVSPGDRIEVVITSDPSNTFVRPVGAR